MKLKNAVRENCGECGCFKREITPESYGCDNCKKPIDEQLQNPDTTHRHYLRLDVFKSGDETEHFEFCSWKCLLKRLPKIKCDYFISLPFLTFDNRLEKGIRAKDFFALIK